VFITALENATQTMNASTVSVSDSVATGCTIALIVLLAVRELIGAYSGQRLKLLRRFLLVIIIPLLFVFALIVITRIMDVW
jgi:hypothetical protein